MLAYTMRVFFFSQRDGKTSTALPPDISEQQQQRSFLSEQSWRKERQSDHLRLFGSGWLVNRPVSVQVVLDKSSMG